MQGFITYRCHFVHVFVKETVDLQRECHLILVKWLFRKSIELVPFNLEHRKLGFIWNALEDILHVSQRWLAKGSRTDGHLGG